MTLLWFVAQTFACLPVFKPLSLSTLHCSLLLFLITFGKINCTYLPCSCSILLRSHSMLRLQFLLHHVLCCTQTFAETCIQTTITAANYLPPCSCSCYSMLLTITISPTFKNTNSNDESDANAYLSFCPNGTKCKFLALKRL